MPSDEDLERSRRLHDTQSALAQLLRDFPSLVSNLHPGDGVDVDLLLQSYQTLDALLNNRLAVASYLEAPQAKQGRQPITIADLDSADVYVSVMRKNLQTGTGIESLNAIGGVVRDLVSTAAKRANSPQFFDFLGEYDRDTLQRDMLQLQAQAENLGRTSELNSALSQAKQAASNAEASATKASSAAGKTSQAALSSHYQKLSADECKAANRFRFWTIITGVLAGATAAVFLVLPEFGLLKIAGTDYAHLLQRVIVTAAVFGMAGYLARQAHQHRSLANWAGALAVQLKTFEAYLDPIDDQDTQNELRRSFAARAFGDHPAMKGDPSVTPTAGMLEKAMEITSKTLGK